MLFFCFTTSSFQAFREILNWFSSYLALCWYCVVLQATPVVSCFKTCNFLAWRASAVGNVLVRVSGSFFRSFVTKFTQIHLGSTLQFFLCPADKRWLVALWQICFAGNFNQTLQFTLCLVYLPSPGCFLDSFNPCAVYIASCFKIK